MPVPPIGMVVPMVVVMMVVAVVVAMRTMVAMGMVAMRSVVAMKTLGHVVVAYGTSVTAGVMTAAMRPGFGCGGE